MLSARHFDVVGAIGLEFVVAPAAAVGTTVAFVHVPESHVQRVAVKIVLEHELPLDHRRNEIAIRLVAFHAAAGSEPREHRYRDCHPDAATKS
jgi:hypothetical protein